MTTYALVSADERPVDLQRVADHLAEVSGRTVLDVRAQLHHGRGLLATHLTPAQAQAAGARLRAAGVAVVAIPDAELTPPARPVRVTKARVLDDGLEIEDQLSRRRLEPWLALRLLVAGCVRPDEPETPKDLTAVVPGEGRTLRIDEEDERRGGQHLLDLVFGEVAPRHYRIDAGTFNYQYLATDGRLKLRSEENFVTLVQDVLMRSPAEAWATPSVRALARWRLDPRAVVPEARLYDAEVRWRVQLTRLGERPPDQAAAAADASAEAV